MSPAVVYAISLNILRIVPRYKALRQLSEIQSRFIVTPVNNYIFFFLGDYVLCSRYRAASVSTFLENYIAYNYVGGNQCERFIFSHTSELSVLTARNCNENFVREFFDRGSLAICESVQAMAIRYILKIIEERSA